MRLYRLIALLLLIESRGKVKAREIADALETSLRTVYRDIEILCQAGVPIAAETGPNGGIRFMEGYSAALYNLREEDAVNLYLSGAGMFRDSGGNAADLQAALVRLEKCLPAEYSADIRAARERFYFDEAPWWGGRPVATCLEEMRKSVWGLKKLSISYAKDQGGCSVRTVRPYGLVLKNMQWYLVAFCENSGEIRTFNGTRVTRADILDEPFMIPLGFSLEAYWKGSVEAFRNARRSSEQYSVRIRLPENNAGLLERLEVYDSCREGETITASVNMHKFEFAKAEALDIVWQAEIISPPELRQYICGRIAEMSSRYEMKK